MKQTVVYSGRLLLQLIKELERHVRGCHIIKQVFYTGLRTTMAQKQQKVNGTIRNMDTQKETRALAILVFSSPKEVAKIAAISQCHRLPYNCKQVTY